jgi:hypothetical protein
MSSDEVDGKVEDSVRKAGLVQDNYLLLVVVAVVAVGASIVVDHSQAEMLHIPQEPEVTSTPNNHLVGRALCLAQLLRRRRGAMREASQRKSNSAARRRQDG